MIFPDIESYVEFIAGYKTAKGTNIFAWHPTSPLSLATYDVGVVDSLAIQIQNNVGLSDRQARLVDKMIATYTRQLAKFDIEPPTHKNYRLKIRVLNRTKALSLADGKLHMRFPYDQTLIDQIKEFAKTSHGRVQWEPDEKVWEFALSEFNLSWAVAVAEQYGIRVEPEVSELFSQILEAEKTPYKIELVLGPKGLEITNAPDSLTEYINEHVGFNDIVALVDNAGALGYDVSPDIQRLMTGEFGEPFMKLCAAHSINMTPAETRGTMGDIIDWAMTVNRLPIVIFNPNFTVVPIGSVESRFKPEEIMRIALDTELPSPFVLDPGVKVVYTNKVITDWQGRMPLLISYANLLYGTKKQLFLSQAEKVVYHCEPLPKR